MSMLYALVALCFCGSVLAQVPTRSACPRVSLQPNFNAQRWFGKWYEQERYYVTFELQTSCNTYIYTPNTNGSITVTSTLYSGFTQSEQVLQRIIRVLDRQQPARMVVQVPLMPPQAWINFLILGTDYDTFAVVYSCNEYDPLNLQFAWIITREQYPSRSVINRAYQVLDRNRINRSHFFKTDKTNCENESHCKD